tara:strand:+ start:7999 stop:8823 length:825 start_codon:yes stop_codon:yes gene_type:complete
MFLIPIILVAIISISHVVTWYDIANPLNWAIYLSVAIEIAAMTALVAVSTRVKGGIWFMFSIVTLIQVIGNVFFCFKEIDENGELFKSWVELTSPLWEMMGTDVTDTIGMKRWLALLEGGLLPIISLTSLHFFVNYDKRKEENNSISEDKNDSTVDEYNTLTEKPEDETEYLLKTKANRDNLEKSIQQAEELIKKTEEIYDDVDEEVILSDINFEDDVTDENISIVENEDEILEKAIKKYNEVKPQMKKIQTDTGKVNKIEEDKGGSKNIQRID